MTWFSPKCPVDAEAKAWIEESMLWLIEEFGADTFRNATVVLPMDEFFPDPFEDDDDVRPLVDRVCSYMGVDSQRVEIEIFDDETDVMRQTLAGVEGLNEGVAGHYQKRRGKFLISLESSQLHQPTSLIATVAHELGHVRLLGEQRIPYDLEDHEPLTDLLTVCLGLGVFTGNTVFRFTQWTDTFSQGWQSQHAGYLTEEMFGYALGLFAWIRNENNPEWSNHLKGNVRDYFNRAHKYLEKTGDTMLNRL